MPDQAPSAQKLVPIAASVLAAFLPPVLGDWRREATIRPQRRRGGPPEPAFAPFTETYGRYVHDGASVELTITDLVEVGLGSVTAPPPLTTVVNEYGTTTFARHDGRLLTSNVGPQGTGVASIMAANGVSVAAQGRGGDLDRLVGLIARIDLAGIERLARPALPDPANDGIDGLSRAIAAMAQAAWEGRDPAGDAVPGLALRITPPLPATWPMAEGTLLTWHLYAAAIDPHLKDGERIAGPWGRIAYRQGSTDAPELTRATAGLAALGIQGVKPLAAADADRLARCSAEALHRSLYALATAWAGHEALTRDTLDAFRLWRRMNGVIADAVLPSQAALATALGQR